MAKKTRKLSLKRETVRKLTAVSDAELARVAGGTIVLDSNVLLAATLNCDMLGRWGGTVSCDTRCF